MSLNEEQKKGVTATEGRILILAGAGSGKTSVIVHRIAHLVQNLKVSPESILGLTFTNQAAAEMRKRSAALIGKKEAETLSLGTFHSFCMQVLRRDIDKLGYTKGFTLYDEQDIRRLLGQLARNHLEHEGELPSLEPILQAIASAKNQALLPDQFEGTPLAKQLYQKLHTALRAYNAVDFDALLSLTVELFDKHPEVLSFYAERYRYVMVDEYQDTNPVQYKIAKRVSSFWGNLCVVGDDDQAIYGWRGADLRNILRFEADVVIKLEQNYRSTPTILKAASGVIRNNKERHGKELWSEQEVGEKITIFHAPSEVDEAQGVIYRMIELHQKKKIPWKEMAILYRSNRLARPFELALMQALWEREGEWVRGIPYEVFGGLEFYQRSEIKDLLAYLRVLINPLDEEALLRIINLPRRGISDQTVDLLTQENRKRKLPLWSVLKEPPKELSERAKKAVLSFVDLMETASKKRETEPLISCVEWLVETIGYNKAIEEDVKSDKMRLFKQENVKAFIASLAEIKGPLEDFLGNISLDRDSWSEKKRENEDRVSLMTFHSAKGLEFRICFLVGLEEEILPHERSVKEGSIEEERRLMYVAMTRAKQKLFLSMATDRKKYGKEAISQPSRFLFEIPKDLLEVVAWDC